MGRAGRPLLALAALCWAPWEASGDDPQLVTQEDIDFAEKMKEVDEKACGNPLLGGVSWLAENHLKVEASVEKVMDEESRSQNRLKEHLTADDEFDSGAYISEIFMSRPPLYLSIFMSLAFCVTCCQLRCQCCRCKSRKRVFGKRVKFVMWLVLLLLMFLIVYECLFEANKGVGEVDVGLEAFACGATELVHVTFNGHEEDPTFPGTITVLRDMEDIANFLDEGSEFQADLDAVIRMIGDMYKALVPVIAVMDDLLKKKWTWELDASTGCPVCEEVGEKLKEAKAELVENAGYKLAMQATEDLKPGKSDKTKILEGIKDVSGPLSRLQAQMKDTGMVFGDNVEVLVESQLPQIQGFLLAMTFINIGCAIILVCCGCFSAFLFTFRETVKPEAKTEADQTAETTGLVEAEEFNPYNPRVQFWASRTWSWGFCYCIITLFIGACISTALVPATESCMLLTELKQDSSAVDDFGHAVRDKETAKKLIDGCLINKDGEEALLMDILEFPDGDESLTLRKKLADDLSKRMNVVFGELKEAAEAQFHPYRPHFHPPAMAALMEIFMRDEDKLYEDLTPYTYECPLFAPVMMMDPDGDPFCDPQMPGQAQACLFNTVGDDYEAMVMHPVDRNCDRREFAKYLKGFVGDGATTGGRLEMPLMDFTTAVEANKDKVMERFAMVWDKHVNKLVNELSDKTDCRYMGIYYKQLVTGLCAQALVGFNDMIRACLYSGYFATALTVAMYLLWRMALDNYDHHKDLAPEEIQAAIEEENRLRAEADRSNWVLTSGLKEEEKGIDKSLIPESVRQGALASDSFED